MNKALRNFWLDTVLFVLLGLDIASISLARRAPADILFGFGWHIHAFLSILLTLGCFVHTLLHWRWFAAVLTGKAKGGIKLVMNSLTVAAILIANLSGHAILTIDAASRLHNLTGTLALIGLFVHAIKHTRWMIMTARRLASEARPLPQMHSATK